MTAHPLDRPVWHALTTRQAGLACGDAHAWRFPEDHGPFAAAADASPGSLAALAALIPPGGAIWVLEDGCVPPPGTAVTKTALCAQMTMTTLTPAAGAPAPDDPAFVDLTEADAAEMLALATLTEPGPFLARTHRLGDFVGIRHRGRLVAMAGERLRPAGFTEVSGVCTHPDFRGRGHAAGLMRVVAARILARGETPFLHAYASHVGVIALYETLGFRRRRTLPLTILARPADR